MPKGVRARGRPGEWWIHRIDVRQVELAATNLTVGRKREKKTGKGFVAAVRGYGNAVAGRALYRQLPLSWG